MSDIIFEDEELNIIFSDQENTLECNHLGGPGKCPKVFECPYDHFDLKDFQEFELDRRQSIMKKILDHANSCDGYAPSGIHVSTPTEEDV